MKKLITMLSALTITTSIAPLTVACGSEKEKEVKGAPIDVNKITADMIINFKDKYDYKKNDKNMTVTTDKLGTLDNLTIKEEVIVPNLELIIRAKITGIDKSKLIDSEIEYGTNLNNSEAKNHYICRMFFNEAVDIRVGFVKEENNIKQFSVDLKIKGWNEVDKSFPNIPTVEANVIERVEKSKTGLENFLNLTEEQKKPNYLN